jgi:hypothetical protein
MEESLAERQAEMRVSLSGKYDPVKTRRRDSSEVWCEHHYTVRHLRTCGQRALSPSERLIENEPDVMRLGEGESRNKGQYFTYYVPESVARRIHSQACSRR